MERVTILEEDDEVAQRQAKEDLQLHGTTPRPRDPEEFYVSIAEPMQRKFPRKRTASELQTSGFERPSKLRKDNLSEMECVPVDYSTLSPQVTSNDYVPTINWNSGKSPLDAWLNQSALPSATLSLENEPQEKEFREQEATAREVKEIEFFHNVHISTASDQVKDSGDLDRDTTLEFGARIYHRNILDRYPLIPAYLARRLAEANHHRAERLRCKRLQEERLQQTSNTLALEGNAWSKPVSLSRVPRFFQSSKTIISER